MELRAYRERFPILAETTYLINHSLGAMPAEAVVLSCFDFRGPRNRIVFEEGLFPSVRYFQQAQVRLGAQIVVCENDAAIVARAHDAGAHVLLDAYQSAGTVPLDVTALGVDFAVGGSVKWLCGGPGAAWLYVNPELVETLEPALTGWQAHERPFAFEPEQDYARGAARFLTGTPNVPALYAATAGYDVVEEIGVERIRARSTEQTTLLIELLEAAGFESGSPREPERRGGTVVVKTPDFEAVNAELATRGIIVDSRP